MVVHYSNQKALDKDLSQTNKPTFEHNLEVKKSKSNIGSEKHIPLTLSIISDSEC